MPAVSEVFSLSVVLTATSGAFSTLTICQAHFCLCLFAHTFLSLERSQVLPQHDTLSVFMSELKLHWLRVSSLTLFTHSLSLCDSPCYHIVIIFKTMHTGVGLSYLQVSNWLFVPFLVPLPANFLPVNMFSSC